MIRLLATTFVLSTSLSTAYAANLEFDSNVFEVTVFPRGAQVTRKAEGSVPAGDHVIVIDDLPGDVLPDSVRVKGIADGALTQTSVDVRQISVSENDQPAERRRLELEIETLQREAQSLNRVISDIGLQRKLLQSLATRAISGPAADNAGAISPGTLDGLLDSAATRLSALQQRESDTVKRQGEINKEITSLQRKIGELAPENRLMTVVKINVSTNSDLRSDFEIEYQVNQAGWQPVYDARLALGDSAQNAKLELVRRALVRQSTGEAWQDVSLSLSTARPSSATSAPYLSSHEIDVMPDRPVPSPRAKLQYSPTVSNQAESALMDSLAGASKEEKIVAVAPEPEVEIAGFHAVYKITGTNSIENTGETKSVTIGSDEYPADVRAFAVPRLDQTAYLMAEFTHGGNTPLLPGEILLSRDDVFIGRGRMPLLSVNDSHEISFGSDDQIIIERVETGKKKGESGFVSTVNTDQRTYRTTVTNRHDFEIPMRILDRMPVSNQEDIVVEMADNSTVPTIRNVDDRRGILAWDKSMAPAENWIIDFGYTVSWPEEMKISRVD